MKKLFNHTKRPQEQWRENGQNYDWDEIDQEFEKGYDEEYFVEEDEFGENDYEQVMEYDREAYAEGVEYTEDINEGGIEYARRLHRKSAYASTYENGEAYTESTDESNEAYIEGTNENGEAYAEGSYENGEAYAEGAYESGETYEEGFYENGEAYAEDAYESGEAYEEGFYENGEAYAEDAYESGEAYEEGFYENGEAYTEDIYEGDEAVYEEGFYENDEVYEEDIYGSDEVYEEENYAGRTAYANDMHKGYADSRSEEKGGIFGWFRESIFNMSGLDRVITITGVAVLLLAIATGGIVAGASVINKQISEFVEVGKQLDRIDTIGEKGLMVLTDNRIAKLQAAAAMEDEQNERNEYQESDYNKDVKVSLETTSVFKDLKLKFVNTKTEKLIANVPFAVTVTKPDGKSEIWSDDDMDGIIYKKDITAGNYVLSVNALTGEKYESYTLPTSTKTVEVKKDITYKKVDVKNEIKKESEINLSKEEAKKNQLEVESALKDTVAWVESTSTALTYREVSKSTIPDPRTLARAGAFMRLTATTETAPDPTTETEPNPTESSTPESTQPSTPESTQPSTPESTQPSTSDPTPAATLTLDKTVMTVEAEKNAKITATLENSSAGITAESSNSGVATVGYSGNTITVTGVAAGTTIVTVKAGNLEQTCLVTVEVASEISINPTNLSLAVGEEKGIKISLDASSRLQSGSVSCSPSNYSEIADIVTDVNANTITVKGKKAGSITITVKHPTTSQTAVCTVTVTENLKLSLDKDALSLTAKGTGTINATLESGNKISGSNVASSNTNVATVSVDNNNTITVTGVAAGEAIITVTHPSDAAKTATCKVTVAAAGSISLNKKSMTLIAGGKDTITVTLDNSKTLKAEDVTSSDTDIAKVEVSGNTVTVTGVAAGSADITIKHPDGSLTEKCTVTVKDGGSLLKDKDGNQIYIIENDQYREAKYSDYEAIQQDKHKVYIKGDAKYTGWQTLNGKVYFFNASGDKVTGEQVIQGAKYNFASDGSLMQEGGTMGIDVSKYNGNIDWNAVKNSGVSYVIIRVGYRGYTQGSLVDDSKFATNIKGATAAGLKVGVYFFTQAVDQVEAVEEASMVLERIKGYTISYPVFLDVEPSGGKGRADSLSKESRTAVCKAFCETIQNSGYTAGIYANKTWLTEKIDVSQLSSYKIWLAQYAAAPTYKGRYDMWQYKSTGKVSGISGNVDMNISYLGY